MSFQSIMPIWQPTREKFQQSMQNLIEQEISLKLSEDSQSIGFILRHNAEVEYMFAEWFFGCKVPEGIEFHTSGRVKDEGQFADVSEVLIFLEEANNHLTEAMRVLPDEKWDEPVETILGTSTPREAIGRLLYHTGIHSGQISMIRKHSS